MSRYRLTNLVGLKNCAAMDSTCGELILVSETRSSLVKGCAAQHSRVSDRYLLVWGLFCVPTGEQPVVWVVPWYGLFLGMAGFGFLVPASIQPAYELWLIYSGGPHRPARDPTQSWMRGNFWEIFCGIRFQQRTLSEFRGSPDITLIFITRRDALYCCTIGSSV